VIIIKSEPISIPIVGNGLKSGTTYVSPDTLKLGKSYSMKRGRLRIHPDGSGKHPIPPEWMIEGVTVSGRRGGGPDGDSFIHYEYFVGKKEPEVALDPGRSISPYHNSGF